MGNIAAASSLIRRDLVLLWRQPSRTIATLATPAMFGLFLAGGFGAQVTGDSGDQGYGAYLIPGVASLVVLFSSIFSAISLIQDRNDGLLQAVLLSPTPRWVIATAKIVSSSLVAGVQASIILAAGLLVGGGFGPVSFLLALAALACVCAAVTGIGLAAAWWIDSTHGFHGVMNLVLMPMWLLSGSFTPEGASSGWLRVIMQANPLRWAQVAIRDALAGQSADPLAWAITVAFGAAGAGVAIWAMSRRAAV